MPQRELPFGGVTTTDGAGAYTVWGCLPRKKKYDLHVLVLRVSEGVRDGYDLPHASLSQVHSFIAGQESAIGMASVKCDLKTVWDLFVSPAVRCTPNNGL